MDFRSDNVGGAASAILAALGLANTGTAGSYGDDDVTRRMNQRFCELFEREVAVFPVATGTAANALCLSVCTPPYGLIYCHETAHVLTRECGATEFFTGGAKLVPLPGPDFKIERARFEALVDSDSKGMTSKAPPCALSLTQATDWGTIYRPAEIAALCEVARRYGLKVHMDGARFANAVVSAGGTPAELSWKAGVDILSFGATKNGALGTDAIVLFDLSLANDLKFRLRRAGQVASKMRFASVQLERYVQDGLWLQFAGQANEAAARLARAFAAIPQIQLMAAVEANQLFVRMPKNMIDTLQEAGARFYHRPDGSIRLVCRYDMPAVEIEQFIALVRRANDGA